jgi:hypothetical protein
MRGAVGPGMSATTTRIATLGRLVSQALSLPVPGEGLRAAEDRGFEPRRAVKPNRISSVLPPVPGWRRHVRDGTETQARRAGNSLVIQNHTGNARRVRARSVRAAEEAPGHFAAPSSAAGTALTIRSIVVRAMPVSLWTSLLLRPAAIAAWTTASRLPDTASCSAAHAVSISLACPTVSSVMHRTLQNCSAYCNRRASPITGRQVVVRVRDHGSRNGAGCGCSGADRGWGTAMRTILAPPPPP